MRDRPDVDALTALADAAGGSGSGPDAVALAHAIAAREAAAGAAPVDAWAARLARLYDASEGEPAADPAALERRLAAELRAGALDRGPRRAAVRAHLIATVRAKLAEVAPDLIASWSLLDEVARP